MTAQPDGARNSPSEAIDPGAVRIDHRGQYLGLEWGRLSLKRLSLALVVATVLISTACLAVAFGLEATDSAGADNAALGGFVAMAVGTLAATGVGHLAGRQLYGGLSVGDKFIETSMKSDPYEHHLLRSSGVLPEFKDQVARSEVVSVSSRDHKLAGLAYHRPFEVVAELRSGDKSLLALGVTGPEAVEIVAALRAHLGLRAPGAQGSQAWSKSALAELHDGITQYRKGPVIGTGDVPRQQDAAELS